MTCSSGCCGGERPPAIEAVPDQVDEPPCCRGKPAPCCDESCLNRVALRACERENQDCQGSVKASKTPCSYHAQKAKDSYAATLEALGCICRALIALGQESCCIKKERPSTERKRRSTSISSLHTLDSCAIKPCEKPSSPVIASSFVADSCSKGCCGQPNPKPKPTSCARVCCDDPSGGLDIKPYNIDLEKGYSNQERVVLSVTGMTCSGCETKLQRTLGTLSSVKNLKTSLVLSRAEFDLDLKTGSVLEVIKYLERTTEFKCERITNQGFYIDFTVADTAQFLKSQWPKGVTDVTVIDKTTVRVSYDPEIIGARDLLENSWEPPFKPSLAPLRLDQTLAAGNKHVRHIGYMTLLSAILTIPVLVFTWAPLPDSKDLQYECASLVLATFVQIVACPFYHKALKSLLFSRVIEMDLLIVLSTSAAYIFSVISFGYLAAGTPLSTGSFFETSTLLVTLIMVGRFVAALARQKAVESISVRSLQANTAILTGGKGDEEIDLRLLQFGDLFKVVPESKIPTDGTVVSGLSEADESMITGESKPAQKRTGSAVIAGTINGSGTLVVRVSRLPGNNTIDTIAGMVDEAKLSKPKIQDLADRVASMFVPVIVVLMMITLVIWIAVGLTVHHLSGAEAVIQSVTYAMTVLIVSCPCAIGLAVPMVVVIATGVGAENGVIFKSAESIEVAHRVSHVILDKTGTLTEGKLTVFSADNKTDQGNAKQSASLLLGMVEGITHPVSTAITAYLKANGTVAKEVLGTKAIPGKGLEATLCHGKVLRAGNSRWLGVDEDPRVKRLLAEGCTVFCFTIDGALISVFGLRDSIRTDTQLTINALQERGISVHVLSGDDDGAVRSVTDELGIPDTNVRSRCTPAEKQEYVQEILNKCEKPIVIFCGDGTNDAVALAQATVGIAISRDDSSGADVAKSAADVVLMRPNLRGILTVMNLSRKSVRRIMFNFAWSFVYNLFAVLLAAGAFVNVRIPPEYAGLGELVSVLPVIAAAVVMRWEKV
ncbi:E1-E2 ATPase-domain-containing protein [Podospora fimiseda]|uniref:E1-E2 ATPase-domain-containing protein n=1 Tax=Podospora fimiseda TaxID=252190 RepID=A0AAN7BKQ9_9PEZI|nr:E1-E2 ATPase-domain-containing protein [Podospora fimiseda]